MPLTNGAIDETHQQFAPLSYDCLLRLFDCLESSTLIDHLLKGTPSSAIDWIQVRAVWGHMWGSMNVTFPYAASTSVCSWQCVTARPPAADIRARYQGYSCRMWQLLWTITETVNTLFLVVNLLTCVMCCYRSRLVFNNTVAFKTLNSQGSVATHLRCGGIFCDSIITNILLILTVKWFWKSVNIWRS